MNAAVTRNVAALFELADFVESAKFEFDMGDAFAAPSCGTAGCIAGHAAVLWPEVRQEPIYPGAGDTPLVTFDDAKLTAHLGLTDEQATALFFEPSDPSLPPKGDCTAHRLSYYEVDRTMAVAALRRFADTGEIAFHLIERAEPNDFGAEHL